MKSIFLSLLFSCCVLFSFSQKIIEGESNTTSLRIPVGVTPSSATASLRIDFSTPAEGFVSTSKKLSSLKGRVQGISAGTVLTLGIKKNNYGISSKKELVAPDKESFTFEDIILSEGKNLLEVYAYESLTPSRILVSKSITVTYQASGIDNAKYYALLVACQDYDDKSIPKLNNPIKETETFAKVLREKYGFEVEVLKNITRSDFGGKLLEYKSKLGADDNLLLFFAGHGISRNSNSYWQFKDAKNGNIYSGCFSAGELTSELQQYKSKHILVMSDACFSGNFCARAGEANNSNFTLTDEFVERKYSLRSHNFMTSSSLETSPDQSEFTRSFVAYLLSNTNKYVWPEQIYFTIINTIQSTNPLYCTFAGDEGGGFFFRRK